MDAVSIDREQWTSFFLELQKESDRAAAILVAAYVDSLIGAKLKELFNEGNSKTRRKLFEDANGPFSSFSAKVDAAYCLGWLEPDVFHDIGVIRRIRNKFAHQIHGLSFDTPEVLEFVNSFRVPHQLFYDWGQVKLGALKGKQSGIVLFKGEPESDVENVSDLPPEFVFRWAASWVLGILAKNLGLKFHDSDGEPLHCRLTIDPEEE
ncbi:MAG: hypothetical protein WD049_04915 [Candidatus Paceibacterota bacterium]